MDTLLNVVFSTLQDPRFVAPLLLAVGGAGWQGLRTVSSHLRLKRGRSERIRTSPIQSIKFDGLDDLSDIRLFVDTFKPSSDPESYENWEKAERIPLALEDGKWMVDKDEILSRLERPDHPFKFVCNLPKERRRECYACLVDSDYIITGRGRQDPDHPDRWNIWFLMDGPWHDDIQDVYRINQSL